MTNGAIARTSDGSFVDSDGRILFFSPERFERDIWFGSCCFVCGVRRSSKVPFDNEHILPNWLLHDHDLHNQTIRLPNDVLQKYGTYTIPCCVNCNQLLNEHLEKPICEVVRAGSKAVVDRMREWDFGVKVFVWLSLIFLKLHLKDTTLREHRNFLLGDATIAQERKYEPDLFHHVHCVARSPFTQADLSPPVIGSMAVIQTIHTPPETFDLIDQTRFATMAIRMNDISIFVVFDDAAGVLSVLEDQLIRRIDGPLDPYQVREVAAHFAACNFHIRNRPEFSSRIRQTIPHVSIVATHDEKPEFHEFNPKVFGRSLVHLLGEAIPLEQRDLFLSGGASTLFDAAGNFVRRRWG